MRFWLLLLVALPLRGMPADPTESFYDPQAVQTVHLEIKSEDLDRLQRALPERIAVPGIFRWNGQTLTRAGIRYKGNSSSNPQAQHKRSFLIDFDEFERGQRFLGLRHVALDNGIQFGSLFSEPLITGTLGELGVKTSRCNYARLYLNGQFLGIYVNEERIDRPFLERNFGGDRGVLLKVDEGGPGADLRYAPAEAAAIRRTFELHVGREREAYASLQEFLRVVNNVDNIDGRGGAARLAEKFDVDAFLTTTAVLLFAGAFDQYTGWNPHNYYLYLNPNDNRWTYIPWDLDVGFADRAFGRVPVLEGWNAAWPAPVPGRPLMEQIVTDANLLKRYRERADRILEQQFKPDILIPRLRALYARIADDLEKDPFPAARVVVPGDKGYADILASMEAFIQKRYALARAQLDRPGTRPAVIESRREPEGLNPGPASADAPTGLRVVEVTQSEVRLQWVDHADGEVALVVQRAEGAEEFANTIGQPGENITTAIDRSIRPGKTYRYRVYAVLPTPQGPRGTGVSNVVTVTIPDR